MDIQATQRDESIDKAIKTCEEKTRLHRGEASRFFRIILITLIFFAVLQVFTFYSNVINQNKIATFSDELNSNITKLEKDIISNRDLFADLNNYMYRIAYLKRLPQRTTQNIQLDYNLVGSDVDSVVEKAYTIRDTLRKSETRFDSVTNNLRKLPINFQGSLFKVDNTTTYILYGIFILVFGILTSFYRFHLKEVSKYEHFMFGFERIRIAGNNSKTGYDDEVKASLAKDAFTIETKSIMSKDKMVESPIPGHPSSDALTFLMNKVLNAVEITAKPKADSL